jgi:hypothetical protein
MRLALRLTKQPILYSRYLGTSSALRLPHTPESYVKDVDETPATDGSIHRVDPESKTTSTKPTEPAPKTQFARPARGMNEEKQVEFSAAGKARAYDTASAEEPYDVKIGQESGDKSRKEDKLRYGGQGARFEPNSTTKGSGPEAEEAGGRKPERRR